MYARAKKRKSVRKRRGAQLHRAHRRSRCLKRNAIVARVRRSRRAIKCGGGDDDSFRLLNEAGLYFIAMDDKTSSDGVKRMKVGMSTDMKQRVDSYLTYHPSGVTIYGVLYTSGRTGARNVEQYAHYLLYRGLGTNYHTYRRGERVHGHTLEWFSAHLHIFRLVYYMCKYFARLRDGQARHMALNHHDQDEDRFLNPVVYRGDPTSVIRNTPARSIVLRGNASDRLDEVQQKLEAMQHARYKKDIGKRWPASSQDCVCVLDEVFAEQQKQDNPHHDPASNGDSSIVTALALQ